jgi:hypothetical protein
MTLAKQPKLISVEKLRPLNPKKDSGFLMIFRQAVTLVLESERETDRKTADPAKSREENL